VVLAQEEARLLGHSYIGTEHLLLGLLHEGDGVGARALAALDVNLQDVRAEVKEIIDGGGGGTPVGHIPFTPRAKKVLELSLREALQLGHNYIGTEHVLLGLIREGQGVAAQVLIGRGVELHRVRQNVIMLLTGTSSVGVQAESSSRESGSVPEPPPQRRVDLNTCSFCGRRLLDAGPMVTGYRGAICASCIRRASRVVGVAKKVRLGTLPISPLVIGRQPRDGATDAVIATVHRAFAPHVALSDRYQAIEASGDPLPLDYLPRFDFAITRIQHAKASTSVELVPRWPSSDGPMVTVEVIYEDGNYVVSRDAFLNAVRSAPIFRAPPPGTPYSASSFPATTPD
jgi:hypothetical protein